MLNAKSGILNAEPKKNEKNMCVNQGALHTFVYV